VKFYYNETGAPCLLSEIEPVIKHCVWSINERTALGIEWSGIVGTEVAEPGNPVIRWVTPKWLSDHGYSAIDTLGLALTYASGKIAIVLNTLHYVDGLSIKNRRTIMHEMLHPIHPGTGSQDHLADNHAVLAARTVFGHKPRYSLSMADYMPVQKGGSHGHCELTMENDLYIPDIHGHRASLIYIGDGSNHSWKLGETSICPQSLGYTGSRFDGDTGKLYLDDVRGSTLSARNVILAPIGEDQWKLESAD